MWVLRAEVWGQKSWQFPKEGAALSDKVAQTEEECRHFLSIFRLSPTPSVTHCTQSVPVCLLCPFALCCVVSFLISVTLDHRTSRALAQVAGALEKSARVIDVGTNINNIDL